MLRLGQTVMNKLFPPSVKSTESRTDTAAGHEIELQMDSDKEDQGKIYQKDERAINDEQYESRGAIFFNYSSGAYPEIGQETSENCYCWSADPSAPLSNDEALVYAMNADQRIKELQITLQEWKKEIASIVNAIQKYDDIAVQLRKYRFVDVDDHHTVVFSRDLNKAFSIAVIAQ